MNKEDDIRLFGFYDDPNSDTPAFDPGLEAICIYCRKKLELPVRTTSFMVPGHNKSYFYRVHRDCSDKMQEECSESFYEGLIIDTIPQKQ